MCLVTCAIGGICHLLLARIHCILYAPMSCGFCQKGRLDLSQLSCLLKMDSHVQDKRVNSTDANNRRQKWIASYTLWDWRSY